MKKEIVITNNLKVRIKKLCSATEITQTNLIFFLIISALDHYGIILTDDGEFSDAKEIAIFSRIEDLRKDFISHYRGLNVHMPIHEKDEYNQEILKPLTFTLPEYVCDSLKEIKKFLKSSITFSEKRFRITDDFFYSFLIEKEISLLKDCPQKEVQSVKRIRKNKKGGMKEYSEKKLQKLSVSDVIVESFKILEKNSEINAYDWMKYILFQYAVKNNFFDCDYIRYDFSI